MLLGCSKTESWNTQTRRLVALLGDMSRVWKSLMYVSYELSFDENPTNSYKSIIPPNTPFNRQFNDLLKKIFVYDPSKRITAREALNHPWFREVVSDEGLEAAHMRVEKEAELRGLSGYWDLPVIS